MTARREYDEVLQLDFYLFWYDDVGVITPVERLAIKTAMREAKSVEVPHEEAHHSIAIEPCLQRLTEAYRRIGKRVLPSVLRIAIVQVC
jgi:hypothetical protein